ncbi:MAG: hypothetical protein ACRDVW_01320 [Acidimicrobiales bacterium]
MNSHSSVRDQTPFGALGNRASRLELGPDVLDAFTDTKNVLIASE